MLSTIRKLVNTRRGRDNLTMGAAMPMGGYVATQMAKKAGKAVINRGIDAVLRSATRSAKRAIVRSRGSARNIGAEGRLKRGRKTRRKRKGASKTTKNLVKLIKTTVKKDSSHGTYRKVIYGNQWDFPPISGVSFSSSYMKSDNSGIWDILSCGFVFFNALKINDAASILYNNKGKTNQWQTLAFNLGYQDTVVDVLYASASVQFSNQTQLVYDMIIHEYTANENSRFSPSIQISSGVNGNDWVGVPALVTQPLCDTITTEGGFKISDVKLAGWSLTKSHKHLGVAPGQSIEWFQSRKNFKVVMKNYQDPTSAGGNPALYSKGCTHLLLELRCHPYMVSEPGKSIYIPYVPFDNVTYGIGTTVKEVYKVVQPENCVDAYEGNPTALYTDNDTRVIAPTAVRAERTQMANYFEVADRLA